MFLTPDMSFRATSYHLVSLPHHLASLSIICTAEPQINRCQLYGYVSPADLAWFRVHVFILIAGLITKLIKKQMLGIRQISYAHVRRQAASLKPVSKTLYGRRSQQYLLRLGLHARALSTQDYHRIADSTLDSIAEAYEDLIETKPEIDVDVAQGVLTVTVPPSGTYVLNKQPPAQQIWLSSPISGPKHYEWDETKKQWLSTRDASAIGQLLKLETESTTGLILDLKNVD